MSESFPQSQEQFEQQYVATEPAVYGERMHDPRLAVLFEPRAIVGYPESGPDYTSAVTEPRAEQKLLAYATLEQARQSDSTIAAITDKYIPGTAHGAEDLTVVDEIRSNPELRYELGAYLLRDKLQNLIATNPEAVAEHVVDNPVKHPNHSGYRYVKNLRSQEYSAMLAVSMLDGTYEPPAYDPVEFDASGRPVSGVHRATAQLLLGVQPR